MEPNIEACTTSIWPCLRAITLTCSPVASAWRTRAVPVQGFRVRISTHNQLDSVSKGCIHQASNRLAQLDGYLLGGKRENGSQWDDGEEI